jgi:uncharacterized protein (DUF488 family)
MTSSAKKAIYTIGHSLHDASTFLAYLKANAVDAVVDVRSSPYSRRAPQFSRSEMKRWLAEANIRYYFSGRELGGRPDDPALYEGNRASYIKMRETDTFVSGLGKLIRAAEYLRIALVCAEADPITCHRFLLVGRALHERGLDVLHLLSNGDVESHQHGEHRLVRSLGLTQSELFAAGTEIVSEAYALQQAKVAFALSEHAAINSHTNRG